MKETLTMTGWGIAAACSLKSPRSRQKNFTATWPSLEEGLAKSRFNALPFREGLFTSATNKPEVHKWHLCFICKYNRIKLKNKKLIMDHFDKNKHEPDCMSDRKKTWLGIGIKNNQNPQYLYKSSKKLYNFHIN